MDATQKSRRVGFEFFVCGRALPCGIPIFSKVCARGTPKQLSESLIQGVWRCEGGRLTFPMKIPVVWFHNDSCCDEQYRRPVIRSLPYRNALYTAVSKGKNIWSPRHWAKLILNCLLLLFSFIDHFYSPFFRFRCVGAAEVVDLAACASPCDVPPTLYASTQRKHVS